MTGETFSGIAKFIAGVAIGASALAVYHQTTPQAPTMRPVLPTAETFDHAGPSAAFGEAAERRLEALSQQLELYTTVTSQLESHMQSLQERVLQLEEALASVGGEQPTVVQALDSATENPQAAAEEATADADKPLTVATLMEAGIDQYQAAYIVRRQGEFELQRLELRDRAIREGTIGSKEYVKALRELNGNSSKLREEVGDDVYDRYLYATGQRNRVVVKSVIPGSSADQAGIRQGDIILGYGENRVFSWPELRKATSEGYRGEYVRVNVQRGSERLNLLLPRGPLGVRLSTSSQPPQDPIGY